MIESDSADRRWHTDRADTRGFRMATLYVGNLSYSTTEAELVKLFRRYGKVVKVAVPVDRQTMKGRGFAFVEMPDEDDARTATRNLNNTRLGGRKIVVNRAKEGAMAAAAAQASLPQQKQVRRGAPPPTTEKPPMLSLTLAIDPGSASVDEIAAVLEALHRLHFAFGGDGFDFEDGGFSITPAGAEVHQ